MKEVNTLSKYFGQPIKGPAPPVVAKKIEEQEEDDVDMNNWDQDDDMDNINGFEEYDDDSNMDQNDDTINLSIDDASAGEVKNAVVPQLTASSSATKAFKKHRKFKTNEISVMKAQFKLTPDLLRTDRRRLSLELGLEEGRIVDWFSGERKREKKKENPKPKAPRKRRVPFNLPQLKALKDAYKLNQYPTAEEKTAVSKASGLNVKQVASWFKKERQDDTSIIVIPATTITPIIPSPNNDPQLFSDNGRTREPYTKEHVKDATIFMIYQATYKDKNGNPVQTVYGITTLLNPVDVAMQNWKNVLTAVGKIKAAKGKKESGAAILELEEAMNKCGLYCSYRKEVMQLGLEAMPETAVNTGLYGINKTTAKALQFERRLSTLSLGTLMPNECIDDLKDSAQYLQGVTQLMNPDLAPYNQRWVDFSSDAMDEYLKGHGCHPGIDRELIQRFKVKEKYQFDPAKISPQVLQIILDEQQQQLSAMNDK